MASSRQQSAIRRKAQGPNTRTRRIKNAPRPLRLYIPQPNLPVGTRRDDFAVHREGGRASISMIRESAEDFLFGDIPELDHPIGSTKGQNSAIGGEVQMNSKRKLDGMGWPLLKRL